MYSAEQLKNFPVFKAVPRTRLALKKYLLNELTVIIDNNSELQPHQPILYCRAFNVLAVSLDFLLSCQ